MPLALRSPPPLPARREVFVPRIDAGLAILAEARDCAREMRRDVWDFAVEVHSLRAAGLSDSSLRWLLCKGYAEHALETTRPNAPRRTFRRAGNLVFGERSCVVLTTEGAALAGRPEPFPRVVVADEGPATIARPAIWSAVAVPRWDPDCRQELILTAFDEEGWPTHLDDPLPNGNDHDAKQRLHDTIKRLNRHQVHRLIQFRGDGSGCGIIWEARR